VEKCSFIINVPVIPEGTVFQGDSSSCCVIYIETGPPIYSVEAKYSNHATGLIQNL